MNAYGRKHGHEGVPPDPHVGVRATRECGLAAISHVGVRGMRECGLAATPHAACGLRGNRIVVRSGERVMEIDGMSGAGWGWGR